jgi:hypothetical protein
MTEVAVDQVVDVGDSRVTAVRAVLVAFFVAGAGVFGSAGGGVGFADG